MELDRDHVNSGCSTVPREVDSVAVNGEARAIWVILLWVIIYTNALIHDVLESGDGDFIAGNEYNGIGPLLTPGIPWARQPSPMVCKLPQSSLYFRLMRRCHISKSAAVSRSRSALSISTGNDRRAVFAGVRLWEVM